MRENLYVAKVVKLIKLAKLCNCAIIEGKQVFFGKET